MDIERYQRAHALFDALVDAPEPEQRDALGRVYAEDPELGALLGRLLELDQGASPLDTVVGGASGVLIDALQATPAALCGMAVLRELGRGGMGVVYEAQQVTPHRRVALKTLAPLRDTPLLRERLLGEVEALARVEHPGVPSVYQLLEQDGVPVLSMELVRGRPLSEYALGRPLGERMSLLMAVAEAVAAAHAQGVVHRDLKPANVLVTADGQVKVLDFGIASVEGQRALSAGTPQWSAPEQLNPQSALHRSAPATDVYGLGALGWALVTGDPPPTATPDRAPQGPPGLPRPLHAVLEKALSFAPERRHRDAQAFLDDLKAWSEDRVVSPLLGQPGPTARAALRRHRRPLAVAAGVLLLLAMMGAARMGWAQAERARRGEAARVELRAIQRLAERLGPEHPEVQRAVDSFVDTPEHQDLPQLHQAWLWWDEVFERSGVAAGLAWWTAPDADARRVALERLAQRLAEQARWDGLEHVLAALPKEAAPGPRRALAEVRLDLPALAVSATPEQAALLSIFSEAMPLPVAPQSAVVLPDRRVALLTEAEALRLSPTGEVEARWSSGAARSSNMASAGDGAVWWVLGEDEDTEIMRWAPDAAQPQRAEALRGVRRIIFRDLDQDGQIERYTLAPYPEPRVFVAEPPEAPSRPGPDYNARGESRWLRDLVGPDADGATWVTYKGWSVSGVERVEGLPDRMRVTGRVRMFPSGMLRLRAGEGPDRAVAYGQRAGVLPGADVQDIQNARIAYIRGSAEPEVWRTEAPPFVPLDMLTADLNGDGWDDLIGRAKRDLYLRLEGPEGPGPWLRLPGVDAQGAGQLDDDPADELIISDGERGWALGVSGAPPLPRRPSGELPEAWPPPSGQGDDAAWLGLEELVRLQLGPAVARRFEALGARAGAEGMLALQRALELYNAAKDKERVAHAIALRDPTTGRTGPARPYLLRAHDREALWGVGLARAEPKLTYDAAAPPPWRVLAPEAVQLHREEGYIELSGHSRRGALIELPLEGGQRSLELELELELVEMDWSTQLVIELTSGGWTARTSLGRGSGADWAHSHLTLRCGSPDDPGGKRPKFSPGPSTMRLSWLAEAGTLRCDYQDAINLSDPLGAPEGPLLLRIGAAHTASEGAWKVRLHSLSLLGARAATAELGDGARALLGDEAATARLAASGDLVAAMEARRALGLPPRAPVAGTRDALLVLLRVSPERWLERAVALAGDELAALVTEAWRTAIVSGDPWVRERLQHPVLQALPLQTPEAQRLVTLQARALLYEGRLLEADQQLAPLRALDVAEAWGLTAALRSRQGRAGEAGEALERWMRLSPQPDLVLDHILRSPELAAGLQDAPAASASVE